MPKTPTLSATAIALALECPRCFWRQTHQGIPRPRGAFPSITGGMDTVLQRVCSGYRGSLPPLLEGKVPGILGPERISMLRAPLPNGLALTGRLDDTLLIDDAYAPLDHKTRGTPPPEGYSLQYYETQMLIYTALLAYNGYKVREEAYLVYYSPETVYAEAEALIRFTVTVQQLPTPMARAAARIEQACALIAQDAPPAPTLDCEYCHYLTSVEQWRAVYQ